MVAGKNNATCSICGKSYHKCLSCRDSMKLQPWKMFTDTSEHYKVFQVIRGFSTGVYTKDELRSKLKNIDLSDLNDFRPHIKDIIEDALKEEQVSEAVENVAYVESISIESIGEEAVGEEAEIKFDLVVDCNNADESISEVIDETVSKKPVYSRKRNYKIDIE